MFRLEMFEDKRVMKSSLIEEKDAVAFFTTRDLPLKAGEITDLSKKVEENKDFVAKKLLIEGKNLFIPNQTHSCNVKVVFEGFSDSLEDTDAIVTGDLNVALALNFADCVPIIFFDPVKKVVACAHAGWRGTEAKIGVKTVEKMSAVFDSNPKDIVALIGPAIGKCCFEVKEDVMEKLLSSVDIYPDELIEGMNIDLKLLNKIQLLASGVEKIDLSEDCTCCKNELFFSYRKEKGYTARHSAVVMLKK